MLPQLLLDLFDDLVGTPRRTPPLRTETPPPAAPAPRAPANRPAGVGQTRHGDAPAPRAPADRPLTRPTWLAESRVTLAARFAALGFTALGEIRTHANQRTMVSAARGVVRLHAGYAAAPDRVLIAIARFLERRTPRSLRLEARRALLEYPAQQHVPAHLHVAEDVRRRRRVLEPARAGDVRLLQLLRERHAVLNARHFEGHLSEIPLVVSGRMRRKLGHVALEGGKAIELAMSRRHLLKDTEDAWMETLLHEMVHQWQAETGRPVDHGAEFRRKAVALGITPRAVRPA